MSTALCLSQSVSRSTCPASLRRPTPADWYWYHQTHDGDSPRLIYANYICLDRRYDVASSTGDCPALSRAEDQRNAAQGGVIFSYIFPGASTGGSGRNLRPNCAQGQENYTLKGGRIHSVFVHKKLNTDSCRFFNKNASECTKSYFNFHSPDPRHWGSAPRPPGRGGEGRERAGRGKGRGGKEKEGKGRGGEGKFASLPLGDRRPCIFLSRYHIA